MTKGLLQQQTHKKVSKRKRSLSTFQKSGGGYRRCVLTTPKTLDTSTRASTSLILLRLGFRVLVFDRQMHLTTQTAYQEEKTSAISFKERLGRTPRAYRQISGL